MDRYDTKLCLEELVATRSAEASTVGRRLREKLEASCTAARDRKRGVLARQLELLEQARGYVFSDVTPAFADTWDEKLFQDAKAAFTDYQSRHGDLAKRSALDSYVEVLAVNGRAQQEAEGVPVTPQDELERQFSEDMDPQRATALDACPAFQVALLLRQIMRDEETLEELSRHGWWEIALMVLCTESPVLPTESLGLGSDLEWEVAGDLNGDFFADRSLIRLHLDRGEQDNDRQENDLAFWSLAVRAADQLVMPAAESLGTSAAEHFDAKLVSPDEARIIDRLSSDKASVALKVHRLLLKEKNVMIFRSQLRDRFQLPSTSVDQDFKTYGEPANRSGGTLEGQVRYSRDYLINFVMNRWKPNLKRRGPRG